MNKILVILLMMVVYHAKADKLMTVPADAKEFSTTEDFLVDRSLGFFDGCLAAGKSRDKCQELTDKYSDKLKNLLN